MAIDRAGGRWIPPHRATPSLRCPAAFEKGRAVGHRMAARSAQRRTTRGALEKRDSPPRQL